MPHGGPHPGSLLDLGPIDWQEIWDDIKSAGKRVSDALTTGAPDVIRRSQTSPYTPGSGPPVEGHSVLNPASAGLLAAGMAPGIGEAMDVYDMVAGAKRVVEGDLFGGVTQAGLGAGSLLLFGVPSFRAMRQAGELGSDAGRGAEEMLTFRHYGRGAKEDVLDPTYMGTGRAGAERSRPGRPQAVHAYDLSRWGGEPERQFRNDPYVDFQMPRSRILEDPVKMREYLSRARGSNPDNPLDEMERLIAQDYAGYMDPARGIAKIFEEVPLRRGRGGGGGDDVIDFGGTQSVEEYLGDLDPPGSAIPYGPQLPEPRDVDVDAAFAMRGGGFTMDPRTGEDMGGQPFYAVSRYGKKNEGVIQGRPVNERDVTLYRASREGLLDVDRNYLGGWVNDEGAGVLDVPSLYKTEGWARRAGGEADQDAAFNLQTFEDVPITARDRAEGRTRVLFRKGNKKLRAAKQAEIEQGLMPEELEYFRGADSKTRKNVERSYSMAPTPREFASVALRGVTNRGWYRQYAEGLKQGFGPDADRVAALFAATSPRNAVRPNMEVALQIWRNWDQAGRPTSRRAIREIMPRDFDAWTNNVVKALQAGPDDLRLDRFSYGFDDALLSGPKVEPFRGSGVGARDAIVNDTHMARAYGTDPNKVGSRARVIAQNAMVRNTAREIDRLTGHRLTGEEVQEMAWATVRGWTEAAGGSPTRGVIDRPASELAGGVPLAQRVEEAESLEQILRDPQMRRLWEEAGGTMPTDLPPMRPFEFDESLIRRRDLTDMEERIDAARTGSPFYSAVPFYLAAPAAGRGVLGYGEEDENRGGSLLRF